jgi:hypothetical protein
MDTGELGVDASVDEIVKHLPARGGRAAADASVQA